MKNSLFRKSFRLITSYRSMIFGQKNIRIFTTIQTKKKMKNEKLFIQKVKKKYPDTCYYSNEKKKKMKYSLFRKSTKKNEKLFIQKVIPTDDFV